MKLVEIKDIRPGQIWEAHRNQFLILSRGNNIIARMYERGNPVAEGIKSADEFIDMRLRGKFGITHRIEGNKLIEIPRKKLEIDDIFYRYRDNPQIIIEVNGDNGLTGYSPKEKRLISHVANICYKIGILGVTHEFVNDREC